MTIEITESTAMADPDRTQRLLTELHAWGFTLAIDDFGTGYSSLARLKHMPVDVLKIDQAFVRHVEYDRDLAGMVRAMIQLAQSLGMVPARRGDRDLRRVRVPPGERLPFGARVPLRLPGAGCGDPRARAAQGRPARAASFPQLRPAGSDTEELRFDALRVLLLYSASPRRLPTTADDDGCSGRCSTP